MSAQLAPIEVFYSYADADEDLRSELDRHLSQLRYDGLITTWHKRQIIAGTDSTKTLNRYLNTASIILLLVSSDFVASGYCYGTEMERAMERHDTGEARIIPILLRPGDWQSAPFGKLQALPSNGMPITKWRNRDAAFADIVQGIRTVLQDIQRLAVNAPSSTLPRIWNIPYQRNLVFTGREEILTYLANALKGGQATALSQPQAISGLGGIGKTQIAVEYAYQYHQDYQTLFWALADTRESLVSGYITIAELLNLPEKDEKDQAIVVSAVMRWLTTHTEWLLILDNADDLTIVREFVPSVFGGHILITTRAQAMGRLAHRIEVDTMPPDVGALFLLRRAGLILETASLDAAPSTDVAMARGICRELGGLPLALDQAGAYIEETECSLSDYQHLYHRRRAALLKRRGGLATDHPEPITTTWSLSFEKVEQACFAAAELLRLCAFLHPDSIPEDIILYGAAHLGPVLAPLVNDPIALDEAIALLRAYGLIRRDSVAKTLRVHRLVQAVLQDTMNSQERREWVGRAVSMVNEALHHIDFPSWEHCHNNPEHSLSNAQVSTVWIGPEGLHMSDAAAELLHFVSW